MKMFSRIVGRGRAKPNVRDDARRRTKRRPMTLEQLEERQLLAIGAGANVNISQLPGNQAEATIAIDRTDPTHLFAASNIDTGDGIYVSVSTDSGVTWGGRIIADGSPGDTFPLACCDPSAAFDDFGNLFLTYLSQGVNRVVVLNSVDGGQSFSLVTQLGFFTDQPTVTASAAAGSLWLTWEQGGSVRAAGAPVMGLGLIGPFGAQQTVPGSNGGSFGDIAIGPNGQVLVTYTVDQSFSGEGPAQIFTNVDSDGLGPQAFSFASLAADTSVGNFDFIPPQFQRAVDSEPGLAYDRTGGLNDGRVYLVYTDELIDESDDTDIFVRFSDDDGASWSTSVRVNDDLTANSQFLPRIALDQTSGAIAVSWHDSRNDDGLLGPGDTNGIENDDSQFFGTVSSDGGATFEPNVQISTGTSNAEAAANGVDYGDYTGLDFYQGIFFPIWADNSNSTTDNPTAPEFDLLTAQMNFVDTDGPFVVAVDPLDAAVIDGPIDFIDFTFNEAIDATTFDLSDVSAFSVTDTLGTTTNLILDLTGFNFQTSNVLRVFFNPQGPAGDYTITIGPDIADVAGNNMNQDRDGTNGETPDDQFTTTFSITTLVVTSVQLQQFGIVVNFNKDVEPTTVPFGFSTLCDASEDIFIERSGGDLAFAGDPNDTIADICVPTFSQLTGTAQITASFFGVVASDAYRLHVRSGGLTDVTPMDNPLDGEFDGLAPPAGTGNGNVFPSGDGVVGGDFLYRFVTGNAPLQTPASTTPVLVAGTPVDVVTQNSWHNSPLIAVDPLDPLKLVTVYTRHTPAPPAGADTVRVEGAFSINGGQTWTTFFSPFLGFNYETTNPVVPFTQMTNASVAFDRAHNFYILHHEHSGIIGPGNLVLNKFDFNGGAPNQTLFDSPVKQWDSSPGFLNPSIYVDSTLPTFTDPATGATITNPTAGNVYVAANWNYSPAGVSNPSQFSVVLMVSGDGGLTFSAHQIISDGDGTGCNVIAAAGAGTPPEFCGAARHGAPRLAISQGTPDGRIVPGQLTVVWDDFGTTVAGFDVIRSDQILNGAAAANVQGQGGFVSDAFDPGSNPHIPSTSTFSVTVDVTDPRFLIVTDLDVRVSLSHPAVNELQIRLIPPAVSGLAPITLMRNRTDASGNNNNNIGATGANLGSTPSGFFIGTTFNQDSATSIAFGASPYAGHFRPDGANLNLVNGLTPGEFNGTWTLEITDFRSANFGFLQDWELNFTSGLSQGFDTDVTTSAIRAGAVTSPFTTRIPAHPDRGISPAPVVASDNTLGDFSPYQGRLYVAYTDRLVAPAANSDIFVAFSDDGGQFWQTTFAPVNDDNQITGNFLNGTTGLRSQFNPTIDVDDVTGAVVVGWLDARADAANARVATYIAASVDGAQTWSPNVFLNRTQTVLDGYDGSTRVYGPIPDNVSGGNANRDAAFGFGDTIGIVAVNGVIYPVWASNENVTDINAAPDNTHIVVGRARMVTGPRVIDSTMGWVDAPANSFAVTFDRPVDPFTFTGDLGTPSVVLFQADFETGNDGFTFDNSGPDATIGTFDDGLWHRSSGRGGQAGHSGTFSMYYGQGEGPAGGGDYSTGSQNSGFLISPAINLPATGPLSLSFSYFLETEGFAPPFDVADVTVVVSSATTVASNTFNLLDPSIGFQTISVDLSSFVGQSIQIQFSFDTGDAALNNFEGWYVDDVTIVQSGTPPDAQIIHRDIYGVDTPVNVLGVVPTACNILGCTQFQVNFEPQTELGTYRYSVGPFISDRIRLAQSSVVVTPGLTFVENAVAPQVPRRVPPFGSGGSGSFFFDTTFSTIDFNAAAPADGIVDVNVNLTMTHTFDGDLVITLIHPDGTRITLADRNGGGGENFGIDQNGMIVGTTFDDQAPLSVNQGFAPFPGSYRPITPLANLLGKVVNGIYTLEIRDEAGADIGQLMTWSLTIQAGTVVAGTTVRAGNVMDQNGNGIKGEVGPMSSPPLFDSTTAGLHDMYLAPASFGDTDTLPLMITGTRIAPIPEAKHIGSEFDATAVPLPIVGDSIRTNGTDVTINDNATVLSTILVNDSFNVSDLNVTLNIAHAAAQDLDVVLRHLPSDKRITLVADVTAGGANFTNTTFDDESGTRIGSATNAAPYTGVFMPQDLLNVFDGLNAQGTWQLEITDDTANGVVGLLDSWTLDFGTESEFIITDHFPLYDLDVMLDLSGVNLADLRVELVREDNLETVPRDPTRIVLFQPGDVSGATMSRTIFNDEATAALAPGGAPYRSSFRPRGLLASVDDPFGTPFSQSNINGVWSLRITNVNGSGPGTAGALNAWSLIVNPTLNFTNSILTTTVPDNSNASSSIFVPNSFTVNDLNVSLTLDHPVAADLDITLVHLPTGTAVTLVTDVAGGGSSFIDTTFDDQAGVGINGAGATAPYTGHFVPQLSLSAPAVPDFTDFPNLVLADSATTTATILVADPNTITLRDLSVQLDITHAFARDLDIVLRHVPTGIAVTLVTDVAAGGADFTGTTFDDEAPRGINSLSNAAPYSGFFIPEEALSLFDGIDARGAWDLEITDDTFNFVTGVLNSWTLHFGGFGGIDAQGTWRLDITDDTGNNFFGILRNWTLDFGQDAQPADLLAVQGNVNFIEIEFDRDMDPSTFTTVDVLRIIGPAGPIGTRPLGPVIFSTLDTTPAPTPIPDNNTLVSTIAIPDGFTIGDLDVLIDVSHADTSQLNLVLTAPDGVTSVTLIDNLQTSIVPDLATTILDDEAANVINAGTAPYSGRFQPVQSNPGLAVFDGMNAAGTWTLEVTDEAAGVTGTLNRWNLVFTAMPNTVTATPGVAIPDGGPAVLSPANVPDAFPIHDVEVTLNITHPRVQDLEVTLVSPDGTMVPLVANLPATGANLTRTKIDDEGANVITSDRAPYTGTFRPGLPVAGRLPTLSDFHGRNSQGVWTLQVRDTTASGAAVQTLNDWSLEMTPSDFRVLPNPDGTDPDPLFPRTYRVYFPRQQLSGTYAISLSSNILSEDQVTDPRCFITGHPTERNICGLDVNRNAGLKALRRGDGEPNSDVSAVDLRPGMADQRVDFSSSYSSSDVGDSVNGKPIPEPLVAAARPITSRIVIPDNVLIGDINVELTITNQQPPAQRPLMRTDDYDVFLISPAGTRLELFSDIGGAGVDFVQLFLNDEAQRCLKACQPIYVQDGSAPFSDDFRPEGLKPVSPGFPESANGLRVFDGENSRGVWTLEIIDDTANGLTASLRDWKIEISGRTTGLGEHSDDQISTSFRLFTLDPGDPRSSSAWTAVGPAGVAGRNTDSSRTGAIAVDPSDPSGNTLFVAGATSGVWKTTNFLTSDPGGPTYVPLTDFAATTGLHIGSIALYPRNNDPKQTVVYVATGEGDAGFSGVGFLRSQDGGATWRLQDSLNNDPTIPFAFRDHALVGTTSFKVVVDPTFSDGRVAYAALSGFNGGIYKTVDGGLNWVNTRPGQATDVVLDLVNTEVVYGAFRGEGVFISSNRAAQWRLMAGGVNNVQMRDIDVTSVTIPIGAPQGTPSGGNGRISLAKPYLSGDPVVDRAFEGRLYAVVATPAGLLDGVYMTSDFGANWTRLELGRITVFCPAPPIPTNDEGNNTDVDPFAGAGCVAPQGNYDQAIIVDPQNPNRVYVFGTGYTEAPNIAIDVSLTYDGHNYTLFDHDNADGGATELDTVGGAVRKQTRNNNNDPPFCEPFACRDSQFDFGGDAQGPNLSETGLYQGQFNNIASIANNGNETRWSPIFPPVHVDYHDVDVFVDPLTGKSRLVVGTDGGVYSFLTESGLDLNGDALLPDGAFVAFPSPSIGNAIGPAHGSRNGNLQMTQIYGGATQPNQVAAEIAALFKNGGLFYGATQDNGSSKSDPFILRNGELGWIPYGNSGDSGAGLTTVLADDDSSLPNGLPLLGTAYIYEWSCCLATGDEAEVIQRDNEPAVTGLDQENLDGPAGSGPSNDIAINYRDGRELLYSAPSGRLYKTDDAGFQWLEIGAPAVFNNLQASGMAFGAEQPDPFPNDFIEQDEVIYIGLPNGRLLVSVNEGGDNGQEWFDISNGLNGAAVQDIAPNIRQFSGEVFLVTSTGVFWMPEDPQPDARVCRYPGRNDIIPGGDFAVKSRLVRAICDVIQGGAATNVNNPWIDITGTLNTIQHTIFPGAWNGEGTLGPIVDLLPISFTSIKVDDRYQIPDATGQRSPLVYVGGGGPFGGSGAGVFRTFDHGQTWRRFPDPDIDGAPIEGGYLPNANITEIELSIGPYDPQTGLSDFATSLDLLVAHTYGRGTFAVRSAPLIFTSAGGLVSNAPDLRTADDTGLANDDDITRNDGAPNTPLHFDGLTHRGATVRLLEDEGGILTEIGRGLADFFTGDWTVLVGDVDGDGTADGETLDCGQHVIRAQAISASGTVGQVSDSITVTVLNEPPIELVAPDLLAADDSVGPGGTDTDNLTRVRTPRFSGSTFCGISGKPVPQATIRLMVQDPTISLLDPRAVVDPATGILYRTVGFGTSQADGSWITAVDPASALPGDPAVTYIVAVRAEDLAGNIGPFSPTTAVTIDTASPPPTVTSITTDTGRSSSDLITFDQTLIVDGAAEPFSTVTVRRNNVVIGSVVTNGAGAWTLDQTGTVLAEGNYTFTAQAQDRAGNTSQVSSGFIVVVDTTINPPSVPDLIGASDSGLSNTDNNTNDNTPTFAGTAEANSIVTLFSNIAGNLGTTLADANGIWTFTSPVLVDALHNITAQAEDVAGNISGLSGALGVTIDTQPPASPPSVPDLCSQTGPNCPERSDSGFFDNDDYTNDTTPTSNGTAEPNGAVTVFDRFNSVTVTLGTAPVNATGSWTFTSPQLLQGVHNISARNTDVAGNVSTASAELTITIDTAVAPPTVPDLIAASDSGNLSTDNVTNVSMPTFTGAGEANGRIEIFAGATSLGTSPIGAPAPTLGSWTHTSTVALADGVFSITGRVTDLAGNVSAPSGPLSVTIDLTPPPQPTTPDLRATSDTGSSNVDNITRGNSPLFNGTIDLTGNAQVGTTVLIFDGATQIGTTNPSATGVWNFTAVTLVDGIHPITARARDAAGNVSVPSAVLNVTIDTMIATPPRPDLDAASDTFGVNGTNTDNITRDDTPSFSGMAEANSIVTIVDGTTPLGTTLANSAGQWNFTSASLLDGIHLIAVTAVDPAGNASGQSTALAITIDTQIFPPAITGISEDRGPSATDGITNDQTLLINGTAEANSTVTVSRAGFGPMAPSVTANGAGNWTYDNTGTVLPAGTYNFTGTAQDPAGNTSVASASFQVRVDITPPANVSMPTLDLADDTGVQGDLITNNRRPRLVGTTEANAQVTIFFNDLPVVPSNPNSVNVFCNRTPVGIGSAAANGSYLALFTNTLPDGPQTVRVCATDAAGNPAVSPELTFTVDGTPPHVNAFSPLGALGTSTSQIAVTFNKDALNTTLTGDPAFAGSVNNRANLRLLGSGGDNVFGNANDRAPIDLSTSDFLYDRSDSVVDRLTINLRDANGALAPLPNDFWRFTILGTTSLEDVAGNKIDGEFSGAFPSGNTVAGGDFVANFQIAVPPPIIPVLDGPNPSIVLAGTKKVVTQVSITFSVPLNVMSARNPNNYAIVSAGRNGVFDGPGSQDNDDVSVQLATPQYDGGTSRVVRLQALRGFRVNQIFQLLVNDQITDPGGNRLDGDGDGQPGGRFSAFIGRGRSISFRDGDGSLASLVLGGKGGLIDVVLGSLPGGQSIADGRTIRLDGVSGRNSLSGNVGGGNGRVKFATLVGSGGVNTTGLPRCTGAATTNCFEIASVSSLVVDRVLESGESASPALGDSLAGLVEEIRHRRR